LKLVLSAFERLSMSVWKVVPTLTSKSIEISLLMAGAKQHNDTGLSWFRPWAVRPAGVSSGCCIAAHRGACRGELKERRKRRETSKVLKVLIEAKCQYRGCGRKYASVHLSVLSPVAMGLPPPFIGQGEAVTIMSHGSNATYGGMAHNTVELMVVLENLASGGRHGKSCACPGAASTVATRELLVWSPSVCRLEGWADGGLEAAQRWAWWCPVVPGSHNAEDDAAAPGMAA
jgi:hypothetical protein